MMPLRSRVCFLPIRSCTRPKFIVNGHTTRNDNAGIGAKNMLQKESNNHNVKLIKPQVVKPDSYNVKVGAELAGDISSAKLLTAIDSFLSKDEVKTACLDKGMNESMFDITKSSFKRYCMDLDNVPSDLYIILYDITNSHGHTLDLLPYFLQHALLMYPHLKYKEELHKIGDLTSPEIWFHSARSIKRKIFFHYGPTNSGKTYKALERFFEVKKGIYCAPLKLLAHEVYEKANKRGVPCDLITGEERKKVSEDGSDADHVSCTVEMASVTNTYDVAVIDEIQMIKDPSRGYAWTRALLGIVASEIHLCGEAGALDYIQQTAQRLGEEFECFSYKRLTKLFLENVAVESFKNIQKGDCIICFSKREIFRVMRALEKIKVECAVIYGTLPPYTKAYQCRKFNDPKNPCNVLVATDAVGLGLNLNIRRIVFFNIEKANEVISVSLALQIAGRAGRFNSHYDKGYVAAFKWKDVKVLKELLVGVPEPVTKAGLFPTVEQIETFSYYLPDKPFTELIDIFTALCVLNEFYFVCSLTNFKTLATLIEHTPLPIKTIYTFCSSPVNPHSALCQTLFVKFAKKYSLNEVITIGFMTKFLSWPMKKPLTIADLEMLEDAHDCLDLYLWFGNHYPTLFPDSEAVRVLQSELDKKITQGIVDIVKVVERSEQEGQFSPKTEEDLLQKGILTPDVLAKLKSEWLKEMESKNKN